MSETRRSMTVEQFAQLLRAFPFSRRITSVHLHHTWRPNHAQWKKYGSKYWIQSMSDYHASLGWGTIAQHLTIDPEGLLWQGRDWNSIPASAKGNNGTVTDGPFMIEMAGDFDKGKDPFEGTPQRAAAIDAVAEILRRFELDETALRFHNQMTTAKSCPGTSILRGPFLEAVRRSRKERQTPQSRTISSGPFSIEADLLSDLLAARGSERAVVHADAELPESDSSYAEEAARALAGPGELAIARGDANLTSDQLAELIPHVITMREGRYTKTELFQSDAGTTKKIFADLAERAKAATAAKPLRIVVWAHGGLIPESAGLAIAHKHVWWWRKNDVYPIYFVWETGLGSAIKDTLKRAWDRLRGKRGFDVFEHTTDMALVAIVRTLQGRHVWGGMKHAAAAAMEQGNAGADVAAQLGALFSSNPHVKLHALGHSAGSIFHSHFVPAALQAQAKFETMQFLAPAIRIDEYKQRLDATIGNGVDAATIYTMRRSFERADNCAGVYRKSLLYLISHALEGDLDAELLGLDESLHADTSVAQRFGLRGPGTGGRVVWSVTEGQSESRTHGGFDDDAATMTSIAKTIVPPEAVVPYPKSASRGLSMWDLEPDLPFSFADLGPAPADFAPPSASTASAAIASTASAAGSGRRLALCVGINDYPHAPLDGCIRDAEEWAAGLRGLGFDCTLLTDAQATHASITGALERLVTQSKAGDLIVFQAAGHGMNVTDVDGDENGEPDEAFCPHDYRDGRMLIDDDLAAIFSRIPAGVTVTCFLDYCHSGTGTRLGAGQAQARPGQMEKKRFMRATPDVLRRHEDFRSKQSGMRAAPLPKRDRESMREVVFSACQPHESAWESNGSGDFTRSVVPLLSRAGALTNEQFQELIIRNLRPAGRQQPLLDCATRSRDAMFLTGNTGTPAASSPQTARAANLADLLRQAATALDSPS